MNNFTLPLIIIWGIRCILGKYTKGKKAFWGNWGFAYLNILSPKAEF